MNEIEQAIRAQIESIDISDTDYKQAEDRYQAIGKWLQRGESKLAALSPDIYTQGSFALGTVIKPLNDNEDYDIDLVCHLKAETRDYTQEDIKTILGEEVGRYAKANNLSNDPEESRRCWTLIYASSNGSAGFHLDALPSISSWAYSEAKEKYKYERNKDIFQINITDNEKEDYDRISNDWYVSNPRGYAEWFNSKQEDAIAEERQRYSLRSMASGKPDDVPSYAIKTPLQQAIQFLKRHRDIYFQDNNDIKPISIIITTLVAQTHLETNSSILGIIKQFQENYWQHITGDNNICILNPVNSAENFADKWSKYPERKHAFQEWINQLREDLENLFSSDFFESKVQNLLRKSDNNRKYQKEQTRAIQIDFNVPHRQTLEFPIVGDKKVFITAIYGKKYGGFRPKVLKSGELIEKYNNITFKVEGHRSIRGKKKYYWQVVNTGYEAIEKHNCPRGEFYDGVAKRGGRTREENTLYEGTHWVQCFVVTDGECVAKSSEFIVRIKE